MSPENGPFENERLVFQPSFLRPAVSFGGSILAKRSATCRIIPVSKYLVTPIYKPWMATQPYLEDLLMWEGSHNPTEKGTYHQHDY